ncbi:hypothetical protein [Pseudomonas sp.]|uniref:hypothetical protein n=1 Tax=Pseudomonas sp. TaxID=306 RepID=UPI002609002D|nr:hypothetical protein [Pseudomonas sp.]
MSSEFKREERYVVIKIKDLEFNSPSGDKNKRSKELGEWISRNSLRTRECVVVESDWPEYQLVWAMIEHRMAGKPVPDFNLWRRADALQALLTAADERADLLSSGSALGDVHLERLRQIDVENRSPVDDDDYSLGQLAYAAAGYAQGSVPAQQVQDCLRPSYWPWHPRWWKPGSPRRMLVKAGALILAEIERIDRLASKP